MSKHEQSDDLDRILLEQDTLLPSSGFTASVMDAIQQEAAMPAPIPFPWKWALPGIAAMLAALIFLGRFLVTTLQEMKQSSTGGSDLLAWFGSGDETAVVLRTQAAPVLLALAASYVCVVLCRRLAGGGSIR